MIARHDAGEPVDFEREIRSPPELAAELADLHSSWWRLRGLLESVRAGASELQLAEAEAGGRPLELDARTQGLLDLLARFRGNEPRYEVLGEIARGGMGMVLRVREKGVERELALKRMFSLEELPPPLRPLRAQLLRRLLDEAWILSRLDHPGIVPLHELGLDAEGHVYFTMPLVRGRTLAEIFVLAREGSEGWNLGRALGLLQRVCEALAFAHSQGIVHRDLKPANVMVGRFGELQVMDWGLARAQHGPQLASESPTGDGSARGLEGDPALTLGGDVLGTPAYMAPEQARGESAQVTASADVYALGAMLYELLAGVRPYHEHAESRTARALLEHVVAGPPWRIEELAPHQPPELLAICRKAMQRDPELRYPSMEALAEDLRAYREGRVVRALEQGAWAELRKWIGRNRRVAAAILFGSLSLTAAAAIALWVSWRADQRVRFEADLRGPVALLSRAAKLWPAQPERIPDYEAWLREARELVDHSRAYRAELEELRGRALQLRPDDPDVLAAEAARRRDLRLVEIDLRGIEDELGQLEQRLDQPGSQQAREDWLRRRARDEALRSELLALDPASITHKFALRADQERHDRLAAMLGELDPLCSTDAYGNTIAGIERRLEVARSLEGSIAEHAQAWSRACASIANPAECPAYEGLALRPQLGLAPLGRDPQSGLWEFAALVTGEAPQRGAGGQLQLEPASAMVLVLVPGGLALVGARPPGDTTGLELEIDPAALLQETPAHAVRLGPYFLSKFELTQGQWLRLTGSNPSYNSVGKRFGGPTADWCYPVDHMSWLEATDVLAHYGLGLPSEAQWEHAARAGTKTPYWWGPDPGGACGRTNNGSCPDHCSTSLRVDRFGPNPWGFYGILGNLGEWTCDNYWTSYRWEFSDDGSGRQLSPDSGLRVVRGGSFGHDVEYLRASCRMDSPPNQPNASFGLRPVRRVDP